MEISPIEIDEALKTLRHVIFILRDRIILWASEGVTETFGYTTDEVRGKSTRIFYPNDEMFDNPAKEFYPKIHHFGTHTGILHLIKKDGTRLDCLAKGSLLNPDDPSAGHIFVFIEITEWVNNEKALKEQEKMAAVGQVAAEMAHDIRTSLTTAKWFAKMALNNLQSEKGTEYLRVAISEIDQTNRIAQEFLAIARYKLPRFQSTDMNVLLDEIIDKQFYLKLGPNIRIVREYETNLPMASLDPDQIKQAFFNILQNAVDAVIAKEQGIIHIKTKFISDNKEIRITISDNGNGILEKDLSNMGKPFFTTKEKGTGLGLNITYRNISNHGGTIEVESKAGEGTKFRVYLPILVKTGNQNL